jgi:Na+/H+ antiporter NhaC
MATFWRSLGFTLLLGIATVAGATADELSVSPAGTAMGGAPLALDVTVAEGLIGQTLEIALDGEVVHRVGVAEAGVLELRLTEVRTPPGRHAVSVTASGGARAATEVRAYPGWLSIVPPLLAIGLALLFKDVLVSLFLGIFSGALVMAGFDPFAAFARTIDHFLRSSLADADHASILIFSLLLGGMVGVIGKSGGSLGIVQSISGFATNLRRGQLATWAMGMLVFFDDYANTLIVGPTMRPITDRLKISREKLAYIVDSTAAPIASLVPISTWVGYEIGLIGAALAAIGLDLNPYATFVATIPYRFYPIFALILVFAVALFGRDFGPMLEAERRAANRGELLRPGDVPLADYTNDALAPPEGLTPRAINAVLPILAVVVVTLGGLWVTGSAAVTDATLAGTDRLREVFSNADSYSALMWASLAGVVVAVLLSLLQPELGIKATMEALVEGFKSMLLALVVLVLAWALGMVTTELHTADFVVRLTDGVLSPVLVPVIVFVTAAAIAFATGTSWATMAILIPLVVPVVHELAIAAGHAPGDPAYGPLLLGTISSVLAGAVWGDHCSPISDTTILSSMASGCDHIAHVRTQMPYALAIGLLGMVVGDVPTAMGLSPWVSLGVGTLVILVGVRWLGREVVPGKTAPAAAPDERA